MSESKHGRKIHHPLVASAEKFHELIEVALRDKSFRVRLQADPQASLAAMGIEITDPQIIQYLKENLPGTDEALLADGQSKKIFAVLTSASVVVAVSTPAFPKGEEPEAGNRAEA